MKFMAVIYNATRESITEILTELQNEVEQFNGYGTQFRISYSHRLALSTDYNECTLRTLFDKADKYMYENKQKTYDCNYNSRYFICSHTRYRRNTDFLLEYADRQGGKPDDAGDRSAGGWLRGALYRPHQRHFVSLPFPESRGFL